MIPSTSSHLCSAMIPTKTRLQYANGYLELGMINEASEEIESIIGEDRMSLAVISFRMKMYRQAEYWPALEAVLNHIAKMAPRKPDGWINYAHALKEMGKTEDAKEVASKALAQQLNNASLWFSLGCYCSLLGETKEASKHVKKAVEQRSAYAQHNPGRIYYNGNGVLEDYAKAHMWFNLVVVNRSENGGKAGDLIVKEMTSDQIAEAQKMAREWVEKHGDGSVVLQVAEGESVEGLIMQIGDTNSRYRFSIGAKGFMNDWSKGTPAHHCAIGVGHIGDKIEKLGSLLGIEVNRVC